MTLRSIEILGYRGFEARGVVELAVPNEDRRGSGMTIITGPNNSGKSSIIECLRARGGYETPSFSVGIRNKSVDQVEITFIFEGFRETIRSIRSGSSESVREGENSPRKIFCLPSRRTFSAYFGRALSSRDQHVINNGLPSQRSPVLGGFESRLFNILRDEDSLRSFNQIAEEVLGFLPNWSIDLSEQGTYFLRFSSAGHSHSSDGLGEGVVSIFSIVDSIYDSAPGDIIVIDEPELSLHPALQKRLSSMLLRFSKDRQIVISTHSPYFVDMDALRSGAKLVRVVSGVGGSRIHQLSDESIGSIVRLSTGNLYNPHVFGLDARELFFQEDGVILTEGQEDVLLLPEVARQLGQEMPWNFFGWGVGGAGNIKYLFRILMDLGFQKVVAVLDGDKLADADRLRQEFPGYFVCNIPAEDIRTKAARRATSETVGVLDENKLVRDDFREAMGKIFADIQDFMRRQA